MAGEWQEATLGELAEIYDGPHATPSKTNDGPIFLGISNLAQGRIDFSSTEYLSEKDYIRWTRRVTPKSGDIVFSYETRLGEAAQIPDGLRCCLGRRMGLLRSHTNRVDERFLLYAYLGPEFQETLRSRTIHGSTVDRIPLIDLPKFPIRVPAKLSDQKAIAFILGALDDKIECNRQMNETLEAITRAVFKSWFVDFDPVRAKVEGRSKGFPRELLDLSPDSLVKSDLGKIPGGWTVKKWGDLVSLEYGKSLKDYASGHNRYPVYGTNGKIGTHTDFLCSHAGIIVGRKGAYRGIHYCESPFFVIDTAFYVRPKLPMEMRWAYYELLKFDINSMDSGSAIPSTSREDFNSIPVLVPPFEIQKIFVNLLAPYWKRQVNNYEENLSLSAIRDALLPKLLNGEIQVLNTKRVVTSRSS